MLWPDGIQSHDSPFLTDGASNIKNRKGQKLKKSLSNNVHIICLAHCFHHVAEELHGFCSNSDHLISNTKKPNPLSSPPH